MESPRNSSQIKIFSQYPAEPDLKNCIVIPVRNEEKYLGKTLEAFTRQREFDGSMTDAKTFEVLLLANNCTDDSVKIIKEFQVQNCEIRLHLEEVNLEFHQANIGYVRRILMDAASKRLSNSKTGIIMTTDADTCVGDSWIAQTNFEISKGADAVGGRIFLFPDELNCLDILTKNHHLKDEEYQLLTAQLEAKILRTDYNPEPTHHQHFNGSFAVTAECYRKAGGIPDVENMEDCAFFERLELIDAKVRKSNEVVVHTSARFVGRTEVGLSYQLNAWKNLENKTSEILVESAESLFNKFLLKENLFEVWNRRYDVDFVENIRKLMFGINLQDFDSKYLREGKYFGEFYAYILKTNGRNNFSTSTVDQAILDLKEIIINQQL